jgi:hypothetical protein
LIGLAKFHISIHTLADLTQVRMLSDVAGYSILVKDLDDFPELELKQPIYLLADKFSDYWKKMSPAELYVCFSDRINKRSLTNACIDNCLVTRVNGQECPATTQINIYRDGSVRKCPYMPEEPANADYSKGCLLIGSKT